MNKNDFQMFQKLILNKNKRKRDKLSSLTKHKITRNDPPQILENFKKTRSVNCPF